MATPHHALADVIRLVSHLGGPEFSEDELKWATDIAVGRELFEWLAKQVAEAAQLQRLSPVDPISGEAVWDLFYQAVIGPTALYKNELEVVSSLGGSRRNSQERPYAAQGETASYLLPSTLMLRAQALEHDSATLDARLARNKHRLSSAKSTARDLKHAIGIIRKQGEDADTSIQVQQETLSDLSVQADSIAGQCTQRALTLLQTAECQDDRIATLKSQIATLERVRLSFANAVGHLYETLDEGYSSLPPADELQRDAFPTQSRISEAASGPSHAPGLVAAAYLEELEEITRQVQNARSHPEGRERTFEILKSYSISQQTGSECREIAPDVKAEIERAGRLDRLHLLRTQEDGLDNITRDVREYLLPRLQRTYDGLRARSDVAAETEAVVSALIEELEDINDSVESARGNSIGDHPEDDPEDILESAVRDLLKNLLGGGDTERPTVLLTRSDVEAELASLDERSTAARCAEDEWVSNVKGRLVELRRSQGPLLSAAYENSPVNTSPPFAPPAMESKAKEDARQSARELMDAASRLQKESELSSRDRRKLAAFIEKWVSS